MAPRTPIVLPSSLAGALICGAALWCVSRMGEAFVGLPSGKGSLRRTLTPRAAQLAELDADLDALVDLKALDVHTGSAKADFVSFRQNFAETPETLLNKQAQIELVESHAYLTMAAYFDRADVSLPGFKKWATEQSEEKREHAEEFIEFLNLRGGEYIPLDIAAPAAVTWNSALDAVKAALRIELEVNKALLKLHAAADEAADAQMCDFLETHFLREAVETINKDAKIARQLIRAGPGLGEYEVDKRMGD